MPNTTCDNHFQHAQQSSRLSQFCVDVAAEAMFTCSPTGVILSANDTACERLEFSREELVGLTVADIDPNYPLELWPTHFDELRREKKMLFESQHRAKSGRILDVEVSVAYFEFEGHEYICSSVRDITKRKQAESLLKLQHDVLARVASTTEELSETLDELCRLVHQLVPNAMATVMLVDENDGMLRFEAGPGLTKEIREAFEPVELGNSSGSCGAAALTQQPVIVEDTRCNPHWKTLQEIVKRFNLLACWSLPIVDERDQTLGTFAISHQQVTKPTSFHQQVLETAANMASIAIRRKRFEEQLRFAHEELAHYNRLGAVGEMASSLAHELNQPLAALVNHAFILEKKAEQAATDATAVETHARHIREQATRAGDIVSSVRSLIKKQPTQRTDVKLNDLVNESLILMRSDLRHYGIEVSQELYSDLPTVSVDAVQIQQVLVNLIRNAVDAMRSAPRDHRSLVVSTRVTEHGEAEVSVADSGGGLAAGETESVFAPFHTTKDHGMGMGLTISRSIAESHAGRLGAENGEQGATFSLVLPFSDTQEVSRTS